MIRVTPDKDKMHFWSRLDVDALFSFDVNNQPTIWCHPLNWLVQSIYKLTTCLVKKKLWHMFNWLVSKFSSQCLGTRYVTWSTWTVYLWSCQTCRTIDTFLLNPFHIVLIDVPMQIMCQWYYKLFVGKLTYKIIWCLSGWPVIDIKTMQIRASNLQLTTVILCKIAIFKFLTSL